MELDLSYLALKDLAILNENLGDFPTLVDVLRTIFEQPLMNRLSVERASFSHGIPSKLLTPRHSTSTWCRRGRGEALRLRHPYVFMGEHSCEAEVRSLTEAFSPFPRLSSRREFPSKGTMNTPLSSLIWRGWRRSIAIRPKRPFCGFPEDRVDDRLRRLLASLPWPMGERNHTPIVEIFTSTNISS